MAHTFTSIGNSLERLQEAEHFLAHLAGSNGLEFNFELNAFLSASRSVTLVLQKSLAHVPQFEEWYRLQRDEMKVDAAMRFFLELRNISQKQGPVSYVGGSTLSGLWSYRFVSLQTTVPPELIGRDIAECCAEHLQKLAQLVLDCFRAFPFDACPAHAFTAEGMAALGYTFKDVEACLGLPQGYTELGGDKFSIADKLHVFSSEIEPLDIAELERLAAGTFCRNGIPLEFYKAIGHDLSDDVASLIESNPDIQNNPRMLFLKAITQRISDIEEQ